MMQRSNYGYADPRQQGTPRSQLSTPPHPPVYVEEEYDAPVSSYAAQFRSKRGQKKRGVSFEASPKLVKVKKGVK